MELAVAEFPQSSLSRLNYVREKTEKIATDYQRARTVEEIRRCPALPEYFVYGFRRRSHRRHRPEWFRQIDIAGDAYRQRQAGQRGRGDSQGDAAELRRADFGICGWSDDSLGHRKRFESFRGSRLGACRTFCRDAGPRWLCGSG